MKKLSWILIITLLASCLSACGKKEAVIYQEDTASTSDATDDPIRNLDYTVPGDKGTLTVQAQVDTSLAEKNAPVASLSRADFTDADIQTYADLLFDEGSYSLFMPYEFRSIEDLSAACSAWEDTFKSYEDFSTIPEYMIAEYYDATNVLATKKQDTDAANHVVETDGEIKWYSNPYNEADEISYYAHQFCILEGTIQGIHYYLCFLSPVPIVAWSYTGITVQAIWIYSISVRRRSQSIHPTPNQTAAMHVPIPVRKHSASQRTTCRN